SVGRGGSRADWELTGDTMEPYVARRLTYGSNREEREMRFGWKLPPGLVSITRVRNGVPSLGDGILRRSNG
ncbi:MAG: hypothetical protein PHF70_08555, partial [Opitutales bacterium]|nr:hypothetical protein [Opitutales bacterium]